MEVVTLDSKVFRALEEKINVIYDHIKNQQVSPIDDEQLWVDSTTLCRYLNISERTLQRMRSAGEIPYTPMGGKYYYQISRIRELWECNRIKSNRECMESLVTHARDHYINTLLEK